MTLHYAFLDDRWSESNPIVRIVGQPRDERDVQHWLAQGELCPNVHLIVDDRGVVVRGVVVRGGVS